MSNSKFIPTVAHTFPKTERLKSKKLIETLFREGKAFSFYPFRIVFLITDLPADTVAQSGFSVPVSLYKLARDRNRIKRLAKEAWRLQKHELYEPLQIQHLQLALFFVYTAKKIIPYQLMHDKISIILKRLITEVQSFPIQKT